MYVDAEVDVIKGVFLIGFKKEDMGGIRIIDINDKRDQLDLLNLKRDIQDPDLVKVTLGKDFLILYLDCFFGIEAPREQFFDLRDYAIRLGILKSDTETVWSLSHKLDIDQYKILENIRWRLEQRIKIEMHICKKLNEQHKELYAICKSKIKSA